MIIFSVYFNGVFQGQTENTYWPVPILQYEHIYNWRIDTYNTLTSILTIGDIWTFTTKNSPSIISNRPSSYDPNLIWGYDPISGEYAWTESSELIISGGGKYQNQLVVIGQDANINGTIYYQTIYDEPEPVTSFPIIGSNWNGESASVLYITGNHEVEFLNQSYTITGSSNGNNGTYNSGIDGVFFNSGENRTEIAVDGGLINEPIDGSLTVI
jgi:hypothetical protein